jgi:hypothetical protein
MNTNAAPLGSGSRALSHLLQDTMSDLQEMCTDFAAELDLYLSTAGSADGVRSTSGLAGKCLWSPEHLFDDVKCCDGLGERTTYSYTGPVNPRAVTTTSSSACMPQCRLNNTAKAVKWQGSMARLPANVTYSDYTVQPDMHIYTAPHCWRVTRVEDMAFRIDLVYTVHHSAGFRDTSRLYIAMARCMQSLGGWKFLDTDATTCTTRTTGSMPIIIAVAV